MAQSLVQGRHAAGLPRVTRITMYCLFNFPYLAVVIGLMIFFHKQAIDVFKYQDAWGLVADMTSSPNLLQTTAPYYPSWGTWFHPHRLDRIGAESTPLERLADWLTGSLRERQLLYQLGGNGPWIQRIAPDAPSNALPQSCSVDQVHMLSRHAERYPTKSAGGRHLALLRRLKDLNISLNGSLSFLNEWEYFTDNAERDFEQLTSTGPYAGTLGSFTTGVRFRTRYSHLLPKNGKTTTFWASDSERVIETAKYFAAGFFGIDWEKSERAKLEIIPETLDRHTDTLTPGDTCARYIEDTNLGHDYGRKMLEHFQNTYIPPISHRLVNEESNLGVGNFSNLEVYSMQEMCGFETIARGSSPWCDIFTRRDWDQFEYARDVLHFYRGGPGNPYAGAMGWVWLNATSKILETGPSDGTMFFSFGHDGDLAPVLTALDIFHDSKYGAHLPVTHVAEDRVWRTSMVMPMGGRITLERLTCTKSVGSPPGTFVRININDDVVQLADCHSGPGKSCNLEQFVAIVSRRRDEVGSFVDVCETNQEDTGVTFLRQPIL